MQPVTQYIYMCTAVVYHYLTFWDESNEEEVCHCDNETTPKPFIMSHISFLSAPPRITSSRGKQTVNEGSDLALFCNATGRPIPTITWTRVLEDGTSSKLQFVGSPWGTKKIRRNFTGQYRCTADNGIGSSVNHTIFVNVLCEYTPCISSYLNPISFA